jgi:hypothetical protein
MDHQLQQLTHLGLEASGLSRFGHRSTPLDLDDRPGRPASGVYAAKAAGFQVKVPFRAWRQAASQSSISSQSCRKISTNTLPKPVQQQCGMAAGAPPWRRSQDGQWGKVALRGADA